MLFVQNAKAILVDLGPRPPSGSVRSRLLRGTADSEDAQLVRPGCPYACTYALMGRSATGDTDHGSRRRARSPWPAAFTGQNLGGRRNDDLVDPDACCVHGINLFEPGSRRVVRCPIVEGDGDGSLRTPPS